jgi:hypothetical protein
MRKWLEDFVYKTKLSADVFSGGAGGGNHCCLTISYQSIKAALMNPIKRLKSE